MGSMAGACLITCLHLGFSVGWTRALLPALATLILGGAVLIGRTTGRPRLERGATAFLQITLFGIVGVVLAYALAARGGPLWDDALASADVALGIDWPAIWRAADRWPVALWIGAVAYHSLTVQMVVCIVVLSATCRVDRLRAAVAAAIASGFVTIGLSAVMPAMGNLFDPEAYRNLWPSVAWSERHLVAGLRDGSVRELDLGHLMGIVSFPSYHATLPVILAWAQRDVPRMRIAAPIWAGVTILATPLFGGHYAVDVIAGLVLAIPAVVLAPRWVTKRSEPAVRPIAVQARPASSASIASAAASTPPAAAISVPIRSAA